MTTGQYVKHAVSYFIKLLLLLALVYGLLYATGYARVSAHYFLTDMFASARGILLLCGILIWSAVYPRIGFVSRTVGADMERDRDTIIGAFGRGGYALTSEEPGVRMTFRASSPLKRLWMAFGDGITVTAEGNSVVLTGIRKEVVQTEFRIKTDIGYRS
jgi:hypothetical protein